MLKNYYKKINILIDNSKSTTRNKSEPAVSTAEWLLQCMLALLIMQRNGQFVAAFPF